MGSQPSFFEVVCCACESSARFWTFDDVYFTLSTITIFKDFFHAFLVFRFQKFCRYYIQYCCRYVLEYFDIQIPPFKNVTGVSLQRPIMCIGSGSKRELLDNLVCVVIIFCACQKITEPQFFIEVVSIVLFQVYLFLLKLTVRSQDFIFIRCKNIGLARARCS